MAPVLPNGSGPPKVSIITPLMYVVTFVESYTTATCVQTFSGAMPCVSCQAHPSGPYTGLAYAHWMVPSGKREISYSPSRLTRMPLTLAVGRIHAATVTAEVILSDDVSPSCT